MHPALQALPSEFLERLSRIVPPGQLDAVARTLLEPAPTTFRVNTLKAQPRQVREQLEAQRFRLEPVSWYPAAFILRQGRLRDLQETEAYRSGALYVQSLASMLPALALDPQPGEQVLDLTAAPGSKTTQMACLMQGQGRLVANDQHRVRFFKLRANVAMQGAAGVELMCQDGVAVGRQQPERFDRVLLDAPCSAEGRFQVREPASYRYWKPRKIREMVHKQRPLLFSAIAAARPGGVVVYSTCTFAPEENEGVIHWAMGKYEGRVALEPLRLPINNVAPGLTAWDQRRFHPTLSRAIRVLPTPLMGAFFIAKLRKH